MLLLSLTKGSKQGDEDKGDDIHWLLAEKWKSKEHRVSDVSTANPNGAPPGEAALCQGGHQHGRQNQARITRGSEMKAYKMWITHKLAVDFKGGLKWKVTLKICLSNRPVICRGEKQASVSFSFPFSFWFWKAFSPAVTWPDAASSTSHHPSKVHLVTTPGICWSGSETQLLQLQTCY